MIQHLFIVLKASYPLEGSNSPLRDSTVSLSHTHTQANTLTHTQVNYLSNSYTNINLKTSKHVFTLNLNIYIIGTLNVSNIWKHTHINTRTHTHTHTHTAPYLNSNLTLKIEVTLVPTQMVKQVHAQGGGVSLFCCPAGGASVTVAGGGPEAQLKPSLVPLQSEVRRSILQPRTRCRTRAGWC